MREAMQAALDAVREEPSAERIAEASMLVTGLHRLGISFGLWAAQNAFFEIWRERRGERALLAPLGSALGFALSLAPEPAAPSPDTATRAR